MLGYLGGFAAYHAVVLPAIFVIGPVLMSDHYDGARSWAVITALFGIGNILGDVLLLLWRPAYALRVGALMLVGASCQAAIIGSHLPVWGIGLLELLTGICVTGTFTLWETSLGEHIPAGSLSRVSSYDYLSSTGMIPLGNVLVGLARSDVRRLPGAPRDDRRRDHRRPRRGVDPGGPPSPSRRPGLRVVRLSGSSSSR